MRAFWNAQLAQHRTGQRPRTVPRRRLQERVHHHPDRPQRRRPEHRRQRLRERVQPRRHRDPHQPVHPGLLHRRPRAPDRGAQRRRLPGPVRRRPLDLRRALGRLPHEDRRHRVRRSRTSPPTGPRARPQPSIEDERARDRRRPDRARSGTMEATDDIDTQGLLDGRRLRGPARPRRLPLRGPRRSATPPRPRGPIAQYDSLLAATNAVLGQTIAARTAWTTCPARSSQPNTANRCNNPKDANWTSPFGFGNWAWEGSLLGAPGQRPGAHADRRHLRLRLRPPARACSRRTPRVGSPTTTTRAAYNAATGHGRPGRHHDHRDQGILDYEFMIAHSQSGP